MNERPGSRTERTGSDARGVGVAAGAREVPSGVEHLPGRGESKAVADPRTVAGTVRTEGVPGASVEVGDLIGAGIPIRVLERAGGEEPRTGCRQCVDEAGVREPPVGALRV